ncbi:MAG: hypothetical protein F6K14_22355 [Symploca sp. SIO2C1]|nr:hypothetical protein [Symploca sp. SIO2C1]
MPYSDFDLRRVKQEFELTIDEQPDLFAEIEPIEGSPLLSNTLDETVQLAISINTEKARSELIIAPVLLEIRRRAKFPISLFSGTEFNIAPNRGLSGYCDYILSRSKEQLMVNTPVVMVVEAKNENIKGGLGQCIAAMVAAQMFNQQEGNHISTIYGAVTTGEIWKFLFLSNSVISIDLSDYYIVRDVGKIIGILNQGIGDDCLVKKGR